ncbi:MAG: EAL domain-containing protein [Agathobacter sp.]|nr:EAL domain-containing protein [Agathobacter sp.]
MKHKKSVEGYEIPNENELDEIVEINLTTGISIPRLTSNNKYRMPSLSEATKRMSLEILRDTIHPEDATKYMAFWDEADLLERILDSPMKVVSGEFRQKKLDGSWGWVRQDMVLVEDREDSDDIVVLCYVTDINEKKKKHVDLLKEMENTRRIDRLTGLLRQKAFFQEVNNFAKDNSIEGYAMIAADIEHFKLFNDWYGWERGDKYLMDVATRLSGVATVLKGFAGYMGGDNFAIFIKHRPEFVEHMVKEIDDFINSIGDMAGFLPNLGLYFVEGDEKIPASAMYDRAVLALNTVKGNYSKRYNIYDKSMLQEIDTEMSVLTEVQKGVEEREFVIYMQPQVHVPTGKITGAETLVRWISKEKGIISPGVFIPVLEKNGFITNLDKYIWEEVCKWQRSRLDRGLQILPVSVNVSRVDAYSIDLVKYFSDLTDKYQIPRSCIKIEITESTYAEDDCKIGKIAEDLRSAGFSVYLDDFGSGYSSLNMLKNIYVDALKIDMQFLDMDESNRKKGESIMESVVNMARVLNIPIIVEGAETEHQIKILSDMGCRYVQGYYYYRPMDVKSFEELLETKEVDYNGMQSKQVEQVHVRDLMDETIYSDTVINNILGAVAFCAVVNDEIKITSVNEHFYKVLQLEPGEFENFNTHINDYKVHKELFLSLFKEAYENPVSGVQCNYIGKRPTGEKVYFHIRVFFLREIEGNRIFYVGFTDTGCNIIDRSK